MRASCSGVAAAASPDASNQMLETRETSARRLGVARTGHRVVGDARDAEPVGRDPVAHAVLLGHGRDVLEGLDHDVLEPLVDLAPAPEEPGAVLDPLEVGDRHAAG